MFFYLLVGGFLFVSFLETIFIFNDRYDEGIFCLFVLGVLCCVYGFLFGMPFPWQYLLVYPVGAICWLPIYWYLSLRRSAFLIRNEKERLLGIGAENWENRLDREYQKLIILKKDGKFEKIKHPETDNLIVNSLFFPVSAPIFILENSIRSGIKRIQGAMNRIRDRISGTI